MVRDHCDPRATDINTGTNEAGKLQRDLKSGYNRVGRIVDQLEADSVFGGLEGSYVRRVLVANAAGLEALLDPVDAGD